MHILLYLDRVVRAGQEPRCLHMRQRLSGRTSGLTAVATAALNGGGIPENVEHHEHDPT